MHDVVGGVRRPGGEVFFDGGGSRGKLGNALGQCFGVVVLPVVMPVIVVV